MSGRATSKSGGCSRSRSTTTTSGVIGGDDCRIPPFDLPESLVSAARAAALGLPFPVDTGSLLEQRAEIAGYQTPGRTSCSGASRLLETADGWIALSLARPDDTVLLPAFLPALLERELEGDDLWDAVAAAVRTVATKDIVERGRLLGLPIAGLGDAPRRDPVIATQLGNAPRLSVTDARVADLSALWAGPLCGALLARGGASVMKVESTTRPDGARRGSPEFFDALNAEKRAVTIDFAKQAVLDVLAGADVVIESSRPRALEQLGIDAIDIVRNGRPRLWVSITGYGREDPQRNWVALGDDAAVAGGLVGHDDTGPLFCADAVADPLTGIVAASAVCDALTRGGRWLLDISMSAVARAAAHYSIPSNAGG